ncbi:unnamed protein product [Pleuronectes platessa]|uniref:Uncharacterized protein n=1 Tax=Pleuronectes platessa TaxID=8262 RepID=A0A9N7VEC8_PLEPL|nr:unnamed protein product [Pleuronectes platessa]
MCSSIPAPGSVWLLLSRQNNKSTLSKHTFPTWTTVTLPVVGLFWEIGIQVNTEARRRFFFSVCDKVKLHSPSSSGLKFAEWINSSNAICAINQHRSCSTYTAFGENTVDNCLCTTFVFMTEEEEVPVLIPAAGCIKLCISSRNTESHSLCMIKINMKGRAKVQQPSQTLLQTQEVS